ncbi:MAG: tetratricopeptide repeat protein [Terriglobia bacterium]
MIRSEGSLSGRERNVFYLNLGGGQFIDISGVTGLEYPQDGRAYSLVDLDQDGDLDLILKNRNAPQVRVLRNETENRNHSIAFRLIGRKSNRDAVGTVVKIETAAGQRTKHVMLGSGFVSQSTKTLYFGLGPQEHVERASVSWPSGRKQTFVNLPAEHQVTLVEGEEEFTAVPFQPRNSDQRVCAPQQVLPSTSPREGIAMLGPVALPPFELKNLAGDTVTRDTLVGQPTIVNFWATWCVPCQTEMRLWKEHYQQIRAAGASMVAISVDEPSARQKVEEFVHQRQLSFPVLLMDATTLERVNLFYRLLFERSGDMQIPTTLLLDDKAQVVKIYRGVVPIEVLLRDLSDLRADPLRLTQAAMPYPGRRLSNPFFRDYYRMGATFYESGMIEEARFYLRESVEIFPWDAEAWESLGVVYAQQGELERALETFQQAVRIRPGYAGAYFNLGVLYRRLQRLDDAERALARAAELEPTDPGKQLEYGMTLAQNGKPRAAIKALEGYLKSVPGDAQVHNDLGVLYAQAGSPRKALQTFQRATELAPNFAGAFLNLGIAYLQQQMPFRAAASLERVVTLSPDNAAAFFALADAYVRTGRQADAERMLERVIELQPDHPRARDILQQLRQSHPGS